MTFFDKVTARWGDLKFMDEKRASFVRDIITKENCVDLLEVGFWKGKSSAYYAAILEDLGRGHLTTIDRKKSLRLEPGINTVLKEVGLSHRVTPIFAHRSHTWILGQMLAKKPRPQFDFCYFDGGHTWDPTALGILLVSLLIRPGGILIVDDLGWTIKKSIAKNPGQASLYEEYSKTEQSAKGVMMAWNNIVPALGFTEMQVENELDWGIARKI